MLQKLLYIVFVIFLHIKTKLENILLSLYHSVKNLRREEIQAQAEISISEIQKLRTLATEVFNTLIVESGDVHSGAKIEERFLSVLRPLQIPEKMLKQFLTEVQQLHQHKYVKNFNKLQEATKLVQLQLEHLFTRTEQEIRKFVAERFGDLCTEERVPPKIKQTDVHVDYTFGRTLYDGNFGTIICASRKSDEKQVAVKRLSKSGSKKSAAYNEVLVHFNASLASSTVIPLYDIFEDCKYVYIIMELAEACYIDTVLDSKHLMLKDVLDTFSTLSLFLESIHSKGILYRDFKLDNLLVTKQREVFVSDFGISCFKECNKHEDAGSESYQAPEISQGKAYCEKVDVYSFGISLYTSICGTFPCPEKKFSGKVWENVPSELKQLIDSCIEDEPQRRPHANQITHKLEELRGSKEVHNKDLKIYW